MVKETLKHKLARQAKEMEYDMYRFGNTTRLHKPRTQQDYGRFEFCRTKNNKQHSKQQRTKYWKDHIIEKAKSEFHKKFNRKCY
jgi:translation initiation factor IF-3